MQIKFTALAVLLLATALSGCGGGGGGAGEGGSSSVPPQPILPDCIIYALDCTIYNRYITQGLSHEQASERTQDPVDQNDQCRRRIRPRLDWRRRHDRFLRIRN